MRCCRGRVWKFGCDFPDAFEVLSPKFFHRKDAKDAKKSIDHRLITDKRRNFGPFNRLGKPILENLFQSL